MTAFKDSAKTISFIILVSLAPLVLYYTFFNFIPAKLNEAEDKAKDKAKQNTYSNPPPRFIETETKTSKYNSIYEVTDRKNKVTYLVFETFKGTVVLSKVPTSATNAILLEVPQSSSH
jgi:hypothetical protein